MIVKILGMVLVNLGLSLISFAQMQGKNIPLNSIYLEAFGTGGFGSINYEKMLYHSNSGSGNYFAFSGRVGFGSVGIKDYENRLNPDLVFPLMATFSYGQKFRAEIGIGSSFSSQVRADNTSGEPFRNFYANGIASLGLVYWPTSTGLMFRLAYTPIWNEFDYWNHWGALSIGYAF